MKNNHRIICCLCLLILLKIVPCVTSAQSREYRKETRPAVCTNHELLKYVRLIKQACTEARCNFNKLKEINSVVDKPTLLAALQSPYLHAVHIFFPINETQLDKAFDWNASKADQLTSLRAIDNPGNAVIFVLGQASAKGGHDLNIGISQARMENVLSFLRDRLQIPCHSFRGAWLGKEIFQLSLSDAHFLNVPEQDYRSDEFVLNQSVHIFVFPCADVL